MRIALGTLAMASLLGCGARAVDPLAPSTEQPHAAGASSPGEGSSPSGAVAEPACAMAWRDALPLTAGRRWHAAVLLGDGRAIAAGGNGAMTELFEPAQGDRWRVVGSMGEERIEHTLTALADGRALVVGGTTTVVMGYAPLARTAEVFDPARETWAPTGAPITPRLRHSATLLADGRVLVLGGMASSGTYQPQIAEAEIFDPATGAWRPAAPLAHPRMLHTANLLADGRVIVIGGQVWHERMRAVSEVEVYDPAHDRWSLASPIPEPRSGHRTIVLEDGRLLVVGGWSQDHGRTLLVDLYDPATDRWAEAAELAVGRDEHQAARLADGRVLVHGGQTNANLLRGLREAVIEIYDPRTDRWTQPEGAARPRMEHSMLVLPGARVVVWGGVDSHYDPPLLEVEIGEPCAP